MFRTTALALLALAQNVGGCSISSVLAADPDDRVRVRQERYARRPGGVIVQISPCTVVNIGSEGQASNVLRSSIFREWRQAGLARRAAAQAGPVVHILVCVLRSADACKGTGILTLPTGTCANRPPGRGRLQPEQNDSFTLRF